MNETVAIPSEARSKGKNGQAGTQHIYHLNTARNSTVGSNHTESKRKQHGGKREKLYTGKHTWDQQESFNQGFW